MPDDEYDYDVTTPDMVDPSAPQEPDDETGEGFEEEDDE